jgi:hypothetical protein
MQRRSVLLSATLAGGLLLLTAMPALANTMPAKMQLPTAVVKADDIAVGKVTSIEPKTILIPPYPGSTAKIEYAIAVVKIEDSLKGPKGLTHVRVAFEVPPPPPPPPMDPPGVFVIRPAPFVKKTLAVGNEGCFLLRTQGDETFYRFVDPSYNDFLVKGDRDYEKKVTFVKHSLELLSDPDKGLKSKEAADRLLTAYLLLNRFQAAWGPKAKTEPIDAAQSKLILEAIAGADWTQPDTQGDEVKPLRVFHFLRLTAKDGWNAPQQGPMQDVRIYLKEVDAAAQKWLKDNSATYRIQQWVPETPEKK